MNAVSEYLVRAHIEQRIREASRTQPARNPRLARRVLRRATR